MNFMTNRQYLSLILALTLIWSGQVTAELPFSLAIVSYEVAPRERIWDGTVEAVHQGTISAQTSGRVAEIAFDVNDFVPEGAVVVRLTDTEQRAALQSANANLEETRARLDEAEKEFERISKLFDSKIVSKSSFDQAVANQAATVARINAARSSVATAKEQLGYTVIRAPYAGIVSQRHVEIGELVSPGQAVMSGLSLQSLRINVNVPQSLIDPIRQIGKAFVYVGEKRITAGSLTFYPVADPVTNTFTVRVNLPEGSANLFPGMFIKVGFVVGESRRLQVPQSVIVRRSELTGVYVVVDERVALRQVRLGRTYNDNIEILAGLTEGERVAMDPVAAGIYLKEQLTAVERNE